MPKELIVEKTRPNEDKPYFVQKAVVPRWFPSFLGPRLAFKLNATDLCETIIDHGEYREIFKMQHLDRNVRQSEHYTELLTGERESEYKKVVNDRAASTLVELKAEYVAGELHGDRNVWKSKKDNQKGIVIEESRQCFYYGTRTGNWLTLTSTFQDKDARGEQSTTGEMYFKEVGRFNRDRSEIGFGIDYDINQPSVFFAIRDNYKIVRTADGGYKASFLQIPGDEPSLPGISADLAHEEKAKIFADSVDFIQAACDRTLKNKMDAIKEKYGLPADNPISSPFEPKRPAQCYFVANDDMREKLILETEIARAETAQLFSAYYAMANAFPAPQ